MAERVGGGGGGDGQRNGATPGAGVAGGALVRADRRALTDAWGHLPAPLQMWLSEMAARVSSVRVEVRQLRAEVSSLTALEIGERLDALTASLANVPDGMGEKLASLEVIGAQNQTGIARLLELAESKREPISSETKTLLTNVVDKCPRYKGMCPCCGRNKVISSAGVVDTAVAQWDHFHGRHLADAQNVWPVCIKCHDDMDRSKGKVAARNIEKAQRAFGTFQDEVREWNGALFT